MIVYEQKVHFTYYTKQEHSFPLNCATGTHDHCRFTAHETL